MSLTVRILIALVAGLGCGILLAEWGGAWDASIVSVAQPIGKAWLGGLQMPLIPLIFALLVTGIAQAATTARSNGLAGRAIGLFAMLLVGAASVAALAGPLLLALWPVPSGAVGALAGAGPVSEVPDVRPSAEWLLGFIPVNPLKSAAEGQVVAIVLFALIFGFAVTRIAPDRRAQLTGLFQALADALLVVVNPLSRSPVTSAMFLVTTMISISGLFVLLNAYFLAAVQILVYAGAVMVLFLFVIMLLDVQETARRKLRIVSLVMGFAAVGALFGVYKSSVEATYEDVEAVNKVVVGSTEALARVLFSKDNGFILPFEIVSILLLVAMIGAILLSKKELR